MDPLTLAVPYHAGPDYLRRAIDSALAQTCPDWRLVVVDDAGPEPAEALVRGYADPRVCYARNPVNLGLAGNWNRCLDAAETELVTLLHADDELAPGYVGRMRAAAAAFPAAAAVFCRADVIGPGGRPAFSLADRVKGPIAPPARRPARLRGRAAVERLAWGNFLMCPTACYRRSRLGGRRFAPGLRFVPDLDLFLRLLFDGDELVLLPDRLYRYRRHPASATETLTGTGTRFAEEWACYDRLAASAEARGWRTAAGRARHRALLRLNRLLRGVRG